MTFESKLVQMSGNELIQFPELLIFQPSANSIEITRTCGMPSVVVLQKGLVTVCANQSCTSGALQRLLDDIFTNIARKVFHVVIIDIFSLN